MSDEDAVTEVPSVAAKITTALAQRIPTPGAWSMILQVAPVMYACRFYGAANPEQAAAIMLVGNELGFGLAGSFQYIHIIEGKPSVSPAGALAVVLRSGQLEAWKLEPGTHQFHCWMKRKNGLEYEYTFTLDDAKRAGLIKSEAEKYANSAWGKYEANMLKWRCIGYVLDVLFADLMGGMKRSDEFGAAVDDGGRVIDGEWKEAA
jgi:hypothetical protein